MNFNKSGLRGNAFRCKRDDLSVNRLDYTTLNFCKRQGIKLEKSSNMPNKRFYGIALLFALEIRSLASIIFRPVKGNKAHAEIVTGHIQGEVGEVSSAQYNYMTDELAKKSRIYIDENLTSNWWEADNVNEILDIKL
ncbi:hypothetical protein ACNQGI_02710 [Flavobacterium sp. LS2R12]